MMKFLYCFLIFSITASRVPDSPGLDKDEARKAFELLNTIRQNPKEFSKTYKVNLSMIKPRPALVWNDTLARVAEARAMDMAVRNYFGHVDPSGYAANYYINKGGYPLNADWLKKKKENGFESIQAGAETAEEAIRALIVDKGVPGYGHRYHLLGVGEWNAALVDVGIGFVRGTEKNKYRTYMCVIIARHDW